MASGRVPSVPGGVQAEGRAPRARAHLRAAPRAALPEPPPPRALHPGEHPGHDDHPLQSSGPGRPTDDTQLS
jgi:hypothetical protein